MKNKTVSLEQRKKLADIFKDARDECKKLFDQHNENYMLPQIKALNQAKEYLKNEVSVEGLYKYSQDLMYGHNAIFEEEGAVAKSLYLDVYKSQDMPSILLGESHE